MGVEFVSTVDLVNCWSIKPDVNSLFCTGLIGNNMIELFDDNWNLFDSEFDEQVDDEDDEDDDETDGDGDIVDVSIKLPIN
jgi:hypothetical protein